MSETVRVRLLVISDTHTEPLAPPDARHAFRRPLPKADVLLHCGDLTMNGEHQEYQQTIEMLSKIDAELKLVIAGNHDLTLDENYHHRFHTEADNRNRQRQAHDLWKGPRAQVAGITYLDEGVYNFTLKSGATFSIYASPYTPAFGNWAFPYHRNEDRFNPQGSQVGRQTKCIAQNPIPTFPGVDIVMTHGPPQSHLGTTTTGFDAGCKSLLHALRRAKPRLHCFGHIHEGWGAELVEWEHGYTPERIIGSRMKKTSTQQSQQLVEYLDVTPASNMSLRHGRQTLLVNAAIMDARYRPVNAPWLVDMELPKTNQS